MSISSASADHSIRNGRTRKCLSSSLTAWENSPTEEVPGPFSTEFYLGLQKGNHIKSLNLLESTVGLVFTSLTFSDTSENSTVLLYFCSCINCSLPFFSAASKPFPEDVECVKAQVCSQTHGFNDSKMNFLYDPK